MKFRTRIDSQGGSANFVSCRTHFIRRGRTSSCTASAGSGNRRWRGSSKGSPQAIRAFTPGWAPRQTLRRSSLPSSSGATTPLRRSHAFSRLLSDETALAPWVPFAVVERRTLAEADGRLSIKVVSVGGKGSTGTTEAAPELETDVVSVFNNALHSLAKAKVAKSGILIIIDEFDRIPDKRGLASLLKTLGPLGVKIALIGVATNVQDLILDHESVARQLSDGSVHVPPMTDLEMNEIFDRAEAVLEARYQFSPEARAWIIGVAKGHPFYVHLIGKHALLRTIANGETVVSAGAGQAALQEIALKGSAPIQESAYKTAIGHSYIREYLLKEFSAVDSEEIHTTELYAKVSSALRIDPGAVSVYVGQLASEKYGGVLERTRDRYYRFRDSLFKAYAAARPRLLQPGDQEEA